MPYPKDTRLQPSLDFDVTASHHRGQPRSVAAHDKAKPQKLALWQRIMLAAAAAGPKGITADQLQADWGLTNSTVAARVADLRTVGVLAWNGQTRVTRSGAGADVLVLPRWAKDVCQNPVCGHLKGVHLPGDEDEPTTHGACHAGAFSNRRCPCLTYQAPKPAPATYQGKAVSA